MAEQHQTGLHNFAYHPNVANWVQSTSLATQLEAAPDAPPEAAPDDYYKSPYPTPYDHSAPPPHHDDMTTTRQRQTSNGVPSARTKPPFTTAHSAARTPTKAASQGSVKALAQRFNQASSTESSPASVRTRPVRNISSRSAEASSTTSPARPAREAAYGPHKFNNLKPRERPQPAPAAPSSARRTHTPRRSVGEQTSPPRSKVTSPARSRKQSTSSARQPFFGEVVGEHNASTPGFGIPNVEPTSTADGPTVKSVTEEIDLSPEPLFSKNYPAHHGRTLTASSENQLHQPRDQRRHSPPSRIPVASRRTSIHSDSSSSTKSYKAGSSARTHAYKRTSPVRAHRRSEDDNGSSRTPASRLPAATYRGYRERGKSPQAARGGPKLNAVITSKPPPTSPRLRHSNERQLRPQQPSEPRLQSDNQYENPDPSLGGDNHRRDDSTPGLSASEAQQTYFPPQPEVTTTNSDVRSQTPVEEAAQTHDPDHVDPVAHSSPLTVQTSSLRAPPVSAPLSSTTDFEYEESPVLGIPGSFMMTPPAAHTSPPMASSQETPQEDPEQPAPAPAPEVELLQPHTFQPAAKNQAPDTLVPDDIDLGFSELGFRESIPIMLGENESQLGPRPPIPGPVLSPRLSIGSQNYRAEHLDASGTISYLEEDDSPIDPFINRETLRPDDSASVAFYQSRDDQDDQWTPQLPPLPDHGGLNLPHDDYDALDRSQTSGLTLDSEAYSVINQVLNEYHRSPKISADEAYEFRRRVQAVSPIVAQHRDWDSKESTETYLARLLSDASASDHRTEEVKSPHTEEDETPTGTIRGGIPGLSIYGLDDELAEAEGGGGTAIIYPPESTRYSRSSRNSSATTIQDADSRADSSSERLSRENLLEGSSASPSFQLSDLHTTAHGQPVPPPKDWRKPLPPGVSVAVALPTHTAGNYPRFPIQNRTSPDLGMGEQDGEYDLSPKGDAPHPPPPSGPPPPPPGNMLNGQSQAFLARRGTLGRGPANKKPRTNINTALDATAGLPSPSTPLSASAMELPKVEGNAPRADDSSSITTLVADKLSTMTIDTEKTIGAESLGIGPPPTTSAVFPNEDPEVCHKRLQRRFLTLKELVDTELLYSKDMAIVHEVWAATAEKALPDARDRRTLFSNSEEIASFSYQLWIDLLEAISPILNLKPESSDTDAADTPEAGPEEPAMEEKYLRDQEVRAPNNPSSDNQTSVGFVLKTYLNEFEKLYTLYILNHDAANKLIASRQSDPLYLGWQVACYNHSKDITDAWDLDSLLVKPVQRILKYPLLLDALLQLTPPTHDDYDDLTAAHKGFIEISVRMNQAKKRQETLREATKEGKKEKKKGFRGLGVVKALTSKTEKVKQNAGVSEPFADEEYDVLSQKFGGHFFQLQIIIKDLEKFRDETTNCFLHLNIVVIGFIQILDGAPTSQYPEIESAWRRNAMALLELRNVLLEDHKKAVKERVVRPLLEIWQSYVHPEKLMTQRKKGVTQYLRYKQALDRKDKIDPKLEEAAMSFKAINDTLKDELPKLYELTKKGIQAILKSFVNYQLTWWKNCQKKILPLLEQEPEHTTSFEYDMEAYVARFRSDSASIKAIMDRLAILNGNLLHEIANYTSPLPSVYTADDASSRKSSSRRTESIGSEVSMAESRNRRSGGYRGNTSFDQQVRGPPPTSGFGYWSPPYNGPHSRPHTQNRDIRGINHVAQSDPATYQANWRQHDVSTPSSNILDTNPYVDISHLENNSHNLNLTNNITSAMAAASLLSPTSSKPGSSRGSAVFTSALPMPDSPSAIIPNRSAEELPTTPADPEEPEVLFLAASLFEFNIAHDRREGGIPYLVYVPGEIFDVIGMKGELWLARNQDDSSRTVGWIWEKHFARILPEEV